MKSEKLKVQVSSDLDHEKLIVEIIYEGHSIGILSNEPGEGFCFSTDSKVSGVKCRWKCLSVVCN